MLTAAILSLVEAALLLVVGFVVILASSTADNTDDTFSATDRAGLYVGAGLMNILVAIALIVGAVLLLTRSPNGRPTIVVATLLCVILGIFWNTEVDGIAIGWWCSAARSSWLRPWSQRRASATGSGTRPDYSAVTGSAAAE